VPRSASCAGSDCSAGAGDRGSRGSVGRIHDVSAPPSGTSASSHNTTVAIVDGRRRTELCCRAGQWTHRNQWPALMAALMGPQPHLAGQRRHPLGQHGLALDPHRERQAWRRDERRHALTRISASVVILDQATRRRLIVSSFFFSGVGPAFCAHFSKHRITQTLLERFAARAASSTLFFSAIGTRI
jgi:hypothetical protein